MAKGGWSRRAATFTFASRESRKTSMAVSLLFAGDGNQRGVNHQIETVPQRQAVDLSRSAGHQGRWYHWDVESDIRVPCDFVYKSLQINIT